MKRTFGRAEARHMCFCCRLPLNGLPCTERTTSFNAFLIYYTSPSISFLPYSQALLVTIIFSARIPPQPQPPPRQLVSAAHVSEISSNWIDLSLTCISAQLPFFCHLSLRRFAYQRQLRRHWQGGCERCKTDKRQCLLLSRKLCAMLIAHRKEINHTKLNLCAADVHGSRRTMASVIIYANSLCCIIVTWQRGISRKLNWVSLMKGVPREWKILQSEWW